MRFSGCQRSPYTELMTKDFVQTFIARPKEFVVFSCEKNCISTKTIHLYDRKNRAFEEVKTKKWTALLLKSSGYWLKNYLLHTNCVFWKLGEDLKWTISFHWVTGSNIDLHFFENDRKRVFLDIVLLRVVKNWSKTWCSLDIWILYFI